jgi:hypothetical protein
MLEAAAHKPLAAQSWATAHPFEQIEEVSSVEVAEERQRVLRHIWEKRATIRHLNDRDTEIVFPDKGEDKGNIRSLSFQLNRRLGDIHRDTER